MQVNVTNTQGIITELEAQRNQALSRCAHLAGANSEVKAALEAAQTRIQELEKAAAAAAAAKAKLGTKKGT